MQHEPRRFDNPGRAPTRWPEDAKVRVTWANGRASFHAYPVNALRWSRTDSEWDVDTFWKDS